MLSFVHSPNDFCLKLYSVEFVPYFQTHFQDCQYCFTILIVKHYITLHLLYYIIIIQLYYNLRIQLLHYIYNICTIIIYTMIIIIIQYNYITLYIYIFSMYKTHHFPNSKTIQMFEPVSFKVIAIYKFPKNSFYNCTIRTYVQLCS